MKLHLGCGSRILSGYLNVDMQPPADIVADIREFIPLDEPVEVLAIHVIEHLVRDEVLSTLRLIKGYLARGGRLIVEMPDREKCVRLALSDDETTSSHGILGIMGDRLLPDGRIDKEFRDWRQVNKAAIASMATRLDFDGICQLAAAFDRPGQPHRYLWSADEFRAALQSAGFETVFVEAPVHHGRRVHRDTRWVAFAGH